MLLWYVYLWILFATIPFEIVNALFKFYMWQNKGYKLGMGQVISLNYDGFYNEEGVKISG